MSEQRVEWAEELKGLICAPGRSICFGFESLAEKMEQRKVLRCAYLSLRGCVKYALAVIGSYDGDLRNLFREHSEQS